MPLTIRKPYQKKSSVQFQSDEPSMAKQSFKRECDINNIMAKFQKTGAITHANNRTPEYGFATSTDFRESLEMVRKGQELFNELPSSLRAKFSNKVEKFLQFVQDPENTSEMRELGLIQSEDTSAKENDKGPTTEAVGTSKEKDDA